MASINQHISQCPICKSILCNEIDEKILRFIPATELTLEYPEFSEHTISNHGHRMGLVLQRMKNKRTILNVIVERGISILKTKDFRLDAGHMLKAAELYAKLDGQLVDRGELAITGSDEELLAKARKLGSDGNDSSDTEPDSETDSDTEDTSVGDSSGT